MLLENTSFILADLSSTLHEAWYSFDGSFRFSHCCTCISRTNSPVTATLLPQHWAYHVQLAGLSQLYFSTLLQTDGDIQQYHLPQSWASRSRTVRHGSKLKLYTWSPLSLWQAVHVWTWQVGSPKTWKCSFQTLTYWYSKELKQNLPFPHHNSR